MGDLPGRPPVYARLVTETPQYEHRYMPASTAAPPRAPPPAKPHRRPRAAPVIPASPAGTQRHDQSRRNPALVVIPAQSLP